MLLFIIQAVQTKEVRGQATSEGCQFVPFCWTRQIQERPSQFACCKLGNLDGIVGRAVSDALGASPALYLQLQCLGHEHADELHGKDPNWLCQQHALAFEYHPTFCLIPFSTLA